MKIILFLFSMLLIGSCRFPNFGAKPIEIQGLGSLLSLKQKQLRDEEFGKLVIGISKHNRVNREDANSLLEIFKRNTPQFSNACINTTNNENYVDIGDVGNYLKLTMDYEQLRKPLEDAVMQESMRIIKAKIDFLNPESNGGNFVGYFWNAYIYAYRETQAKNDGKNSKDLSEQEERELEFKANVMALQIFQEEAQRIIDDANSSREQKVKAESFLRDIEIYNEAMPANGKILDTNGELFNTDTAADKQLFNINRLAGGGIDDKTNPKAEVASRQVGDIVRPTAEAIELKVKTSFIPRGFKN